MKLKLDEGVTLYRGDCLEVMPELKEGSIDLVLCDPPYGTTACKWDGVIPFDKIWYNINRLCQPESPIVLFSSEPFSSRLIVSNLKSFKYRWDWDKQIPSGMSYARFRPMQQTEDICVFTKSGGKTVYNPQMVKREKAIKSGGVKSSLTAPIANKDPNFHRTYDYKNPTTLIRFMKVRRGSVHPTQKPVALMEYLIKTYTNEGDTVLDFTMGSGTTGVACVNTGRKFIGIEKDDPKKGAEFFQVAVDRITEALLTDL